MNDRRYLFADGLYPLHELRRIAIDQLARRSRYEVYIRGIPGTGLFTHGVDDLTTLGFHQLADVLDRPKDDLTLILRPIVIEGLETIMRMVGLPDTW